MRNPDRIKPFMQEFAHLWQKNAPNLRFGQLIFNFLEFVVSKTHRDFFYIEDDEMERLMFDFFDRKDSSDECNMEISINK